jgi:collagenase-like PrtC family protease
MPFGNENLLRLSVPHNGDPALPERLMSSEFNRAISEVYFAGNPLYIPSGRRPKVKHYIKANMSSYSFDSQSYDRDLCSAIEFFNSRSVRCNLLLNFEGSLTSTMLAYVDDLVTSGVTSVTVGSVSILTQISRRYGASLGVQNSVYMPVHSLSDVCNLINLGVNILLTPPDFNHDHEFLTKMKSLLLSRHCELKLMVNEGCIKGCPYRKSDLRDAQLYPIHQAITDYIHNPAEIRRLSNPCRESFQDVGIGETNYIHPNDIGTYLHLNPLIKIVGRSFSSDTILSICQAYYRGRHDGDLRTLVENFKHATAPVIHGRDGRAIFT